MSIASAQCKADFDRRDQHEDAYKELLQLLICLPIIPHNILPTHLVPFRLLPKKLQELIMPSFFSIDVLLSLLAIGAIAQDSPVKLCNSVNCDYCPSSITTQGTGYPACVVYDRDTVLGGKSADFPPRTGDFRKIWFDIAPIGGDCQTM